MPAGAAVSGFAFLLVSFFLAPAPAGAAPACSNAVFCGGWHAVCRRTLPPGGSVAVCDARHAACLKTGCYHFNRPGPRCKHNPMDLSLTTSCRGR